MRPTLRCRPLPSPTATSAPTRERAELPPALLWDLADLYPSDEACRAAMAALAAELPALHGFRGTLGRSGAELLAALSAASGIFQVYERLSAYASMASDQDTRDGARMGLHQEVANLGVEIDRHAAFLEPEVLALGAARVATLEAEEPGLAPYRHYLDDVLRRAEHFGSEREEAILAEAGLILPAPEDVYDVFSDADFPFARVTLHDGREVTLDKAAFSLHRASPVAADRARVFRAFLGRLGDFRRTCGATLQGGVKANIFLARARRYPSTLEASLDRNRVPVAVYRGLVAAVNRALPTLHRYLELRRRMMRLERLHYHDLYAPLVAAMDEDYPVERARDMVLEALRPLGDEYVATVASAFTERWIDFPPTAGKRSGAYSNGSCYEVHPYMLLNYNGKYDDVSTLAHELGHAMHSYLANRAQPFPTARYPIFTAEVASTVNEELLLASTLASLKDDDRRLAILGEHLEGVKGTVFRQTQFAEFELDIHERAERGEALTGELLSQLYLDLTRRYYGHDRGVCTVDDYIGDEWCFVSHFYYGYYVYQYATSLTAATALSEPILAGDRAARDRYLQMLAAGGSDYPIELLRRAGVDLTTPAPFDRTIARMERVMDEMDAILARRRGA